MVTVTGVIADVRSRDICSEGEPCECKFAVGFGASSPKVMDTPSPPPAPFINVVVSCAIVSGSSLGESGRSVAFPLPLSCPSMGSSGGSLTVTPFSFPFPLSLPLPLPFPLLSCGAGTLGRPGRGSFGAFGSPGSPP